MSSSLLSLIVPIYNVAAYLPRCLESLAALDPRPDEIIAVDDGSTDGSLRILEEFQPRMANLRILRQANSGVSAARNKGLDTAQGHYLAFVDADDFLAPDAYQTPLAQAQHHDLDIMLFNGWYHFEGREADRLIYPDLVATGPVPGSEWIVRCPLGQKFLHYPPLNLYRRGFLESISLRFVVGQKFHEDVPWTTEALLAAGRVAYDPTPWYYYRKAVRRFPVEQLQTRLDAIVESSIGNVRELVALIEKYALTGVLKKVVEHQMVDGALSIFHKLEQMPDRRRARAVRRELRRQGLIRLLWSHAHEGVHCRRLFRQWLKSFT